MSIHAPARLHLGFLDLNGGLGRRFGSIGVALSGICTEVSATRAARDVEISGPDSERALLVARRFMEGAGLEGGVRMQVHQTIPRHAGLGSGTQMALAVGTAISRLHGLSHTAQEVAAMLGRGRRSGIGTGTFAHGGFIMDGGRGENTGSPPVLSRVVVPEAWRFVLVMEHEGSGISGSSEEEAFARMPDMDEAIAAQLCRLALMQAVPGLIEEDCAAFGAAITRMQQLMGEHFAGTQHGGYASLRVQAAVQAMGAAGAAGVGQSSWGPTGFALFPSEPEAQSAASAARGLADADSLDLVVCSARNLPADIHVEGSLAKRAGRH